MKDLSVMKLTSRFKWNSIFFSFSLSISSLIKKQEWNGAQVLVTRIEKKKNSVIHYVTGSGTETGTGTG